MPYLVRRPVGIGLDKNFYNPDTRQRLASLPFIGNERQPIFPYVAGHAHIRACKIEIKRPVRVLFEAPDFIRQGLNRRSVIADTDFQRHVVRCFQAQTSATTMPFGSDKPRVTICIRFQSESNIVGGIALGNTTPSESAEASDFAIFWDVKVNCQSSRRCDASRATRHSSPLRLS